MILNMVGNVSAPAIGVAKGLIMCSGELNWGTILSFRICIYFLFRHILDIYMQFPYVNGSKPANQSLIASIV